MADLRPLLEAAFMGDPERIRIEAELIGIPYSAIAEAERSVLLYKDDLPSYNEGHSDGFEEGFESGRAEGYNDGYDEGWNACQTEAILAVEAIERG